MPSPSDKRISPPLVDLPIRTASKGFYDGFSREVTIPAKVIVSLLIMWAIFFPVSANETLTAANSTIISTFSGWYVYLVAFLMSACVVLAVIPQSGRLRIGMADEKPEFGRLSWFAMLFGAGIGIGVLTYSTGEPLAHFSNNPDIIRGLVASQSAEAVRSAYIYTFLHWGFAAWGTYALVGLSDRLCRLSTGASAHYPLGAGAFVRKGDVGPVRPCRRHRRGRGYDPRRGRHHGPRRRTVRGRSRAPWAG